MILKIVAFGLFSLATALPSFADSLRCDAANVSIQGEIASKYIRMGKSEFQGDLKVYLYDHRQIVSATQVRVSHGVIQDQQQILVQGALDDQGRRISMNIASDGPSAIDLGGTLVSFVPHCEIAPSQPPQERPGVCRSNLALGKLCSLIQGSCVCHQRNGH